MTKHQPEARKTNAITRATNISQQSTPAPAVHAAAAHMLLGPAVHAAVAHGLPGPAAHAAGTHRLLGPRHVE